MKKNVFVIGCIGNLNFNLLRKLDPLFRGKKVNLISELTFDLGLYIWKKLCLQKIRRRFIDDDFALGKHLTVGVFHFDKAFTNTESAILKHFVQPSQ